MIERVVANWLTSANERQYQIPFCQLLAAEGETIVYISPHGQMEQGKDVATTLPDGRVHGYQLKGGKLTLKDWRAYKGEIDELVQYPINHPSINVGELHKSFLVTNGRVADPVINAIRSANEAWARNHAGPLTLIAGDELAGRFVKAHGRFLPHETKDFTRFLELVVNSGAGQLDKRNFSLFLESVLPIDSGTRLKPLDIQRAVASAVLFTTYVLQGCERVANHWAIFEGWTMMSVYIVAVTSRHKVGDHWCRTSLELCLLGATRALDDLALECSTNTMKFTQGEPLTDGHFYRARITILAGLLGAASLSHRLHGGNWEHEDFVRRFLSSHLPEVKIWGESAVPYLVVAALAIEKHGSHALAESTVLTLINTIAQINGKKGRGLASPYYEPEAALRLIYCLDQFNAELFAGHSYTMEALIQFLARRLVRRKLALIWDSVTHVQFARFEPEKSWGRFLWVCNDGSLVTTTPNCPQSWQALRQVSETAPKNVPAVFAEKPELAIFFSLVYPHRFTPDSLRILEHLTQVS